MGYLIVNHLPFVALAMVLAGIAGWALHQARTRHWWDEQDAEREGLRLELIRRAGQSEEELANFQSVERAALLSDNEAAQERIVNLEQQIAAMALEKDGLSGRMDAALQASHARVASLTAALAEAQTRAAEFAAALEAARGPRPEDEELARLRQERGALDAEIAALQHRPRAEELASARATIAELDAALRARAEPEDELNRTRWRARYLDARVRYLEAREGIIAARLAAPPIDKEAEDRRRWRLRYLEARLSWLETSARALIEERESYADERAAHETRMQALGADRDAAREDLAEALAEVARLAAATDQTQATSDEDALRIAELEGALAAARGEATDVVRRFADAEHDLVFGRDRISALEADLAAEREAHALRESEADAASARADEAVAARNALSAALSDAKERIEAIEAELVGRRGRVSELDALLQTERGSTESQRKTIAELDEEIEDLRARLADATDRASAPRIDETEHRRLRWRARYLESRVRFLEEAATIPAAPTPSPLPFKPEGPSVPFEERRPPSLPAARSGAPDDLRLIDGVGPRIESTLNSLGVFHFDQIAAWTPENVAWIERYLAFKDRIGRERWIEQARTYARDAGTGARRREGEYA